MSNSDHFADLLGKTSIGAPKNQPLNSIGKANQTTPIKPMSGFPASKPTDTQKNGFNNTTVTGISFDAFQFASPSQSAIRNETNLGKLGTGANVDFALFETPPKVQNTPLAKFGGSPLPTSDYLTQTSKPANLNANTSGKLGKAAVIPQQDLFPSSEVTWDLDASDAKPSPPRDIFDVDFLSTTSSIAKFGESSSPKRSKAPVPLNTANQDNYNSPKLTELISMGFDRDKAQDALQISNDDLEAAINYLIGGTTAKIKPARKKSEFNSMLEESGFSPTNFDFPAETDNTPKMVSPKSVSFGHSSDQNQKKPNHASGDSAMQRNIENIVKMG